MTEWPRRETPAAAAVHSPALCPAGRAIALARRGVRRLDAVQLAEHALADAGCGLDPKCHRHAVLTLAYAGDLSSAEAHCAAAAVRWHAEVAVRQGFILLRARIRYRTGDCAGSVEAVSGLLREPARAVRVPAVASLVEMLAQRGDVRRAESLLADHDLLVPGHAEVPAVLAARAAVHLAANRFEKAVDEFLACGRRLSESRVVSPAVVAWRSRAALAALAIRRVDLASALAHDELVAARRWGSPAAVGAALHPVALLRADADLLADAVRLLDVARLRNEQIWALYDLGLMLGRRHDRGAARAKLREANVLAGASGLTRWSRRIRSALDGSLAPGGGTELTRQEAKIARLAAAGHSNRQIAAELCLTVRTIEFHLSGAYRKLGITGRRELGEVIAALF
ncbi:LuxR C-terminal-related transcriptional regulator [Actinophytocola sp.]|uniref:LuxR C-terminal-related transcriptional regulator n=1 Tax=Actinophytocola sp. TaxID=1872138 RepID=UPI00389A39C4